MLKNVLKTMLKDKQGQMMSFNHKLNVKVFVTKDRKVAVDRDGLIVYGKFSYSSTKELNENVSKAISYEFNRLGGVLI